MAAPPNVLFFFTDDQRFDTIAALGNRDIRTPTLDRLVREGTTFTHACIMGGSSPAVCMPSRAMLHTGRHLFGLEGQGRRVPPEHTLLGEALRRGGYRTFGTGKWHNGGQAYARSFTDGANIFLGGMSQHFRVPLRPFDESGKYPREAIYYEKGKHSSDLFADATAQFLRRAADDSRPFFAYLSFTAPHDPRDTHERYHAMYDPADLPVPAGFMPVHPFDNGELRIRDENLAPRPRTKDAVRRHLADYYAMITHADAAVGRVLEALKQSGRAENTIVVFAGDNGLALGRHGLMGKQNLYDHSVRVPLIFAGPGIPAGQRRDAPVYLHDIMPTLLDLCGQETPGSVESTSLASALRDGKARPHEHLLLAYKDCQRGVRDERHKLIEYAGPAERRTQLFDLRSDPHELHDLSADRAHRDTLTRLRKILREWPDRLGDTRKGLGGRFWKDV